MVALETLLLACALGAGDAVLLDFSAPWCQPCRLMEPTIHRLAADGYPVRQINIDNEQQLAAQFRVTAVPCFVLVSGGREVERVSGPLGYGELVKMFQRAGYSPDASGRAAGGRAGGGGAASGGTSETGTVRGQSPDRLGQRIRDRVGEMIAPRRGDAERYPPPGVDSTGVPFPESTTPDAPYPEAQRPAYAPEAERHAVQETAGDTGGSQLSPHERALRSTVRLTVETSNFKDIATGTIIDTHGDEALVVTCGHVFRDSAGKGEITVEFCGVPGASPVKGQLITYDASHRDIALVAIRPGAAVTTMRVAPEGFAVHERMSVFSVGCNNGGPATVAESRVSGINRYLGPPNIEVSGEPVQGRSGGGLFSADGLLIGICNAADHGSNEGIYGALTTIHEQLAQIGLNRLFDPRLAQNEPREPRQPPPAQPSAPLLPHLPPAMPTSASAIAADYREPAGGDVEVIFIVRPRDGSGHGDTLTIRNPSPELLRMMQRESQQAEPPIIRAQSLQ